MKEPVIIDLNNYKRLQHFNYFKSMAYPYVGITCNIDITEFYKWIKANNHPFFLSFLWCVAQAANDIKEFRQRIFDNGIVEYDVCPTSHTVAKDDETYCYCSLECDKSFDAFLNYAMALQERAKINGNIEENENNTQSLIFISTLPWITYTSLIQPVPYPSDSNPRITWGKFFYENEKILLPVSTLCHHALVDGSHLAKFYQKLEAIMKQLIY